LLGEVERIRSRFLTGLSARFGMTKIVGEGRAIGDCEGSLDWVAVRFAQDDTGSERPAEEPEQES